MSTYDDASLVFYPSGYRTSVLYSEKPMDANGQLTFSRASNATRVASNGLIEEVRTNVVTYSQDFNDASWTKTALTISTSSTANPVNGALTAQDAIPTAVLSSHRFFKLSGVASSLNTWSIYAKAKGYNFITIVENGNTSANVSFNLSTGTIGQQNSATGRIESLGNGWYRCSMIHTTSTTPRFDVYVSPTDSIASYTGDGTSGVTLFGAQAETGDIATQYIATTTSARSTFAGITVNGTSVPNVPRIDYTGGGCGKLLLEPQRTNLVTWSEQFNNAAWTKQEVNVTANAAIAPDGTQSADNIVPTAISGTHQIFSSALVSSSQCAMSVFAKANGYSTFQMLDRASGSNGAVFNLANGTVTNAGSGTGTITAMGNGWYRCTAVATTTGVRFYVPTSASNFTGDGTSGVLLWGAQLEAGAYATSYIPTLSTSVTRVAESFAKSSISSLIGQTEGTFLVDFIYSNTDISVAQIFSISDSTTANRVYIGTAFGQALIGLVTSGGVAQANISTSFPLVLGQRYRAAIAYKVNDFAFYLNGVQIGTDNAGTVPAMNYISNSSGAGASPANYPLNQMLVFKTRLSNSTLARLTQL